MKEALASVLAGMQSLGDDVANERPVDRLHALAAVQATTAGREALLVSLGRDLIALKHAGREESRWPAIANLADALEWRTHRLDLKPWQRTSVATWAIVEWTQDACVTCEGKGLIPMHQDAGEGRQAMKQCPACTGTMKRRYSDEERQKHLGNPYLIDKPMATAHGLIGQAERVVVRVTLEMLARTP